MKLGPRGESLIKSYESYRSVAYLPTPDDVPTIGWGHTRGVKMGDTCTPEQAQKWFDEDVSEAVKAVRLLPCELTQSMFDALVSLVFNVGPGAVRASSSIGQALRLAKQSGLENYYVACAGLFLWRKQNRKDLLGLARRRAKEMVLFLEDGIPG